MAYEMKDWQKIFREQDKLEAEALMRHITDEAVQRINENPDIFKYMSIQTPEIREAAVKADPRNIEYVPEKNRENVLKGIIAKDGMFLQNVENPGVELCVTAVKNNPRALRFVGTDKLPQVFDNFNDTNDPERAIREACIREGAKREPVSPPSHEEADLQNAAERELDMSKYADMAINNPEALASIPCQTPEMCEMVVRINPNALQYIKHQTPELCMAAVKKFGRLLEYVKEQTPEICMEAVRQDGLALEYVKEQTPEICMEAVKLSSDALEYVKEQTPEICMAAVQRNGWALGYVKDQTPEICMAAVKQNSHALNLVLKQTPEICVAAVKWDGDCMKYVEPELRDQVKAALAKENKPKHSGPRM